MIESRNCCVQTHAQSALNVMNELRVKEHLCDIVLRVDGAKYHAHKVVLAGCSPYLRAMFTNGMLETDQSLVEIHGIDARTMNLLLEFMYTGLLEINIENVQNILQGASLLGLAALRSNCSQFLENQLASSNCLGIHHFADMYGLTELASYARQFMFQNFLDVVRSEEFYELSQERLLNLLNSDKLRVISEHQVFDAACAWIQYDPANRSHFACAVLKNIRLALLDLSYLENVVLKSEYFHTCAKCQLVISKAIRTQQDNVAMEMITPRAQPPCIYVVGGRNSTDCQLNSMERYDFVTDSWVVNPTSSMNIARTAVGATSLDGLLYAVGGECALLETQEDTLYLRCVECYDPVLKQWIPKTEMKVARSFVAVAAARGCVYAIGGEDRSCSYNIVEKYDPKTEAWSFAPNIKRKRGGAGVAVCDGKIYVAGGFDKILHMDRASVECYDPDTQEWTFVAEMEKGRSGLALVTCDQFIYAIGGRFRHLDQYFDLVERFNTVTKQWTTITPMNTARAWPGVALFDGQIYVLGGFDGQSRLRSAEVYNPETDQWLAIKDMNVHRAGCGAGVV
ncbi:kelch-like protein 1 [Patella vulgata]|uniref:kelch-like protein 1 n=1 Tax=Patella vulgata TaxID=6465 RepID=UPI00218095EC|nr:kelch-like protein 1 [Patella vulgata]